MKKLVAAVSILFFISGCGAAARQSEFYEHSTMYRNESHLLFSVCGYKKLDAKKAEQSKTEDWWGIPVGQSK